MTTILTSENISSTVTLWLAFCSNVTRSVAACVEKTQTVLASVSVADRETTTEWIGQQITTACLNRGTDMSFISGMYDIDNSKIALCCVDTALDMYTRGQNNIELNSYMDGYVQRYGESRELLALKLRWLTLYTNYTSNVDEVERVLAILTEGEAA